MISHHTPDQKTSPLFTWDIGLLQKSILYTSSVTMGIFLCTLWWWFILDVATKDLLIHNDFTNHI